MKLLEVYAQRVKGLKYNTIEDLIILLREDERSLYFVLVYFFLSEQDLSSLDLMSNRELVHVITILCDKIKDKAMIDYYNSFICMDEITDQIENIAYEFLYQE